MTTEWAHWCPACSRPVEAFAPGPGGRPGARCPLCQSLERHRFLALLLGQLGPVVATARAVLDVAPQTAVRSTLTRLAGSAYVGIDLLEAREVDVWADLTNLPFASDCFDVAVCYHVLEHIPDDLAAMRELARVLSPGGLLVAQVPLRRGRRTDEDPSAGPEERVKRFGQIDHVRWYGDDLVERLAECGLAAWLLEPGTILDDDGLARVGVRPDEPVIIARPRPGVVPSGWPLLAALGPDRPATPTTSSGSRRLDGRRLRRAVARVPGARPAYGLVRRLRS